MPRPYIQWRSQGDEQLTSVYELPVEMFQRTATLFGEAWFDEPYMDSVLKGRQTGRIVVDRPNEPTAAIMFRTYEYYIAGAVDTPLRQFIKDAPAEPGVFQKLYGYAPVGEAWEQAILEDYNGMLIRIPRHNFRWNGADVSGWRERLPNSAHVERIDEALAERIDREWHETIGLFWGGYENYVRDAFGFCLLMGDELGSMASCDGYSGGIVNIGVQTAEKFRKQGLAKLTCQAFIGYALSQGIQPTWDTDGMNEPSKALARSLGFIEGRMFSQLSTPDYQPIQLSEGLWSAKPGEVGVTEWGRG
jgi:RimJ/RimL family protein N-acetyltransferase